MAAPSRPAPSRPAPGAVLTTGETSRYDGVTAPRGRSFASRVLPPLLFAALVILAWAWAAGSRPDTVLPSPARVGAETWRLVITGELLRIAWRSMSTMAIGYGVSALVGIGIGLVLARRQLADAAVSPYLIGLQSLPSAVWVPVAVIFLGAAHSAVLAVCILGALPSIAIGTRDAVHGIPPLLIRAARTLGADGKFLLLRIVVPAAMPGIVSGLEHGWAFAFRSLVAGELITGAKDSGLGYFVNTAKMQGRVDRLFAAVFVIMLIGVAVDRLGFARWQRALRVRRGLATS
ncbi:MAG: ABC transporter permease [Mycobacteriales bacterium]